VSLGASTEPVTFAAVPFDTTFKCSSPGNETPEYACIPYPFDHT